MAKVVPINNPSENYARSLAAALDMVNNAMNLGADRTINQLEPVQVLDRKTPPCDRDVAKYIASGGTICPACGGNVIEGRNVTIDEGCAYQSITCNACSATWTDEYELTGISHFEFGPESSEGGPPIDTHN